MNEQIPVKITTNTDLDKISHATIEVRILSHAERINMSLMALAITWFITFIFVFIPILHFVLVPAGFILGIVLFFWRYGSLQTLVKGEVACPKCQNAIQLPAGAFNWPKAENCPHCRIHIKIERADSKQ